MLEPEWICLVGIGDVCAVVHRNPAFILQIDGPAYYETCQDAVEHVQRSPCVRIWVFD
jgi:hypothetical protein